MTTFVELYHPALPGVPHVRAATQAVSEYEARGWIRVDGSTPAPEAIYLTPGVGDLRYTRLADVGNPATTTGAALRAAFVPKWKPSTAYASGEFALNPSGQVVSANTAFTSGTTYSAGNWTVVSGGGGTVSDATTGAKGVVQLAGDLAGTAAAPTVAKINGSTPATVATSGAYADLSGRPSIPATQTVQTIWTTSGALVVNAHNPVDASSAAKTMTLPTGQAQGTVVSVEKEDATANLVTVTGDIRGASSSSLALAWQYESVTFIADTAGSWWPRAGHKTKASLDAAYVPAKHGDPFGYLCRWAPPAQVNPTVYTATGNFQLITAGAEEDVIVNGKTSAAATGALQITGGRHIRIIGGKWAKTTTGSSIRVIGATGSVFIEGVEIDASGYNGDAINACGVQSGNLTFPDVYIQNCLIYGVNGTLATNHADIYQPQGPIGRLFVDRITGSSDYQGFLTAPQFAVTRQYFSRVNLTKVVNAAQPITYLLWNNDDTHDPVPVVYDEVYVALPAGQTLANAGVAPLAGQTSTATSITGQAIGVLTDSDGAAFWPAVTKIGGKVYPGAPARGDFVPAGSVGLTYSAKGYLTAAPPQVSSATGPALTGHCFTADPTDKALGAAAWPSASRQIFMRVKGGKVAPTQFRILVGTASGNIGIAVYANTGSGVASAPSGAPKITTGSIACPATGSQVVAITSPVPILDGDWIGFWCDNVTATFHKFSGTSDATLTAGLVAAMGPVAGGPTALPSGLFGATQVYFVGVE